MVYYPCCEVQTGRPCLKLKRRDCSLSVLYMLYTGLKRPDAGRGSGGNQKKLWAPWRARSGRCELNWLCWRASLGKRENRQTTREIESGRIGLEIHSQYVLGPSGRVSWLEVPIGRVGASSQVTPLKIQVLGVPKEFGE